MIKIGIIGVGNISEFHMEGYLKSHDAQLYAFCDIDEKKLTEKSEKFNV